MWLWQKLWTDERGGLVAAEYLLIGTLLTIGLITAVHVIHEALIAKISQIASMVCP